MGARNIQKSFSIPTYVHPTSLLGPKDSFLNAIREDSSAKISVENDVISMFGTQKEINRIEDVLNRMLEVLGQDENLDKEDVLLYLTQSKNGNLYSPEEKDGDIIFKMGKRIIRAKNQKQVDYMRMIEDNIITFGLGVCGTGKSYIATLAAMKMLQQKEVKKIIISRPNIGLGNGQLAIGFLPGSSNDKLFGYVSPMLSTIREFMSEEKFAEYLEKEVIQILPLEMIRGYSIVDAVLLVDEAQNLRISDYLSILTRIGKRSKLIIMGDQAQTDIGNASGLDQVSSLLRDTPDIGVFKFTKEDIVRSGVVRAVLEKFEKAGLV